MMDLLGIKQIRRGADGDAKSPNAANYDESKADIYKAVPDPLVLNNGKPVTSAKVWWTKRRPEIVELFDREVYGRVPANLPKVTWEVVSTTPSQLLNWSYTAGPGALHSQLAATSMSLSSSWTAHS